MNRSSRVALIFTLLLALQAKSIELESLICQSTMEAPAVPTFGNIPGAMTRIVTQGSVESYQIDIPVSAFLNCAEKGTLRAELQWLISIRNEVALFPGLSRRGYGFDRIEKEGTVYYRYHLPSVKQLNRIAEELDCPLRFVEVGGDLLTNSQWAEFLSHKQIPVSMDGFTAHEYGQHALEYLVYPRRLVTETLNYIIKLRVFDHIPKSYPQQMTLADDSLYELFELGSALLKNQLLGFDPRRVPGQERPRLEVFREHFADMVSSLERSTNVLGRVANYDKRNFAIRKWNAITRPDWSGLKDQTLEMAEESLRKLAILTNDPDAASKRMTADFEFYADPPRLFDSRTQQVVPF